MSKSINELAEIVNKNARDKGFYEKERNIGEMIALIHSEVSEALEADRHGKYASAIDVKNLNEIEDDVFFNHAYKEDVKGTFEEELADIMIRVMDLSSLKNVDLENHIKAKMRYNSLREYKHGKKY